MKKYLFYISVIATLLSGMTSCEKNFDPELYGTLNPQTFPLNDEDFASYTLQVYLPFNAKWGFSSTAGQEGYTLFQADNAVFQYFDSPSDQIAQFNDWGNFIYLSAPDFSQELGIDNGHGHFEKVRFVSRFTQIISDLDNGTILNADLEKQLKGEAHMGRGLLMYYLLYMYGPVPVILDAAQIGTSADSNSVRPSRAEFVAAIESDLTYASENLPQSVTDYGRWTKGAALAYLMKFYCMEQMYAEAIPVGQSIMDLGEYELETNYIDIFNENGKTTKEAIWAISVDGKSDGRGPDGNLNAINWYLFSSDYPGLNQNGWHDINAPYMANWSFYDSFESDDIRREISLVDTFTNTSGNFRSRDASKDPLNGAVIVKFPHYTNGSTYQSNDIIAMRYADVLLLMAEAINATSGPTTEAIDYVNQIRNRAGLADLTGITDKASLTDAIFNERTHEFFMEGFRLLDLIRFGKWNSSLEAAGKNSNCPFILPIPTYAIDASHGKLKQNKEYSGGDYDIQYPVIQD